MSIGKAQAAAIADGFLDGFGSGKDDLRPRETFTEIIMIAGEFIEDAQNNLIQSNSVASGKLSSSLLANEPEQVARALKIDVMMNDYGKFVNKGVKGTKGGTGLYAFQHDKPSKKMVDAITDWQAKAKSSMANVNKKKSISRNEIKNASISEHDKAYAIARSIVQKGIKPTGFLDKAIITTQQKVRDRLGAALKIDIINSITST